LKKLPSAELDRSEGRAQQEYCQ